MSHLSLLKICEFETLKPGWCYGEGVCFSYKTIQHALEFAETLIKLGYSSTDAFPGTNGEVRITAYEGNLYLEFTFESETSVTFLVEENDIETQYFESLTPAQCIAHAKKYKPKERLWFSSGVFIINFMMQISEDFKALRSTFPLTAEYLSLKNSAQSINQAPSATTSECITRPASEIQYITGRSMSPSWI